MIVVKVEMWPKGARDEAHVISLAALDCVGVARQDDAPSCTVKGERAYRVRLFRDVAFRGPDGSGDLSRAPLWRSGFVRGHLPGVGARGTWDLVAGALRTLLGSRLTNYRGYGEVVHGGTSTDPTVPACTSVDEHPDRDAVVGWLRAQADTNCHAFADYLDRA